MLLLNFIFNILVKAKSYASPQISILKSQLEIKSINIIDSTIKAKINHLISLKQSLNIINLDIHNLNILSLTVNDNPKQYHIIVNQYLQSILQIDLNQTYKKGNLSISIEYIGFIDNEEKSIRILRNNQSFYDIRNNLNVSEQIIYINCKHTCRSIYPGINDQKTKITIITNKLLQFSSIITIGQIVHNQSNKAVFSTQLNQISMDQIQIVIGNFNQVNTQGYKFLSLSNTQLFTDLLLKRSQFLNIVQKISMYFGSKKVFDKIVFMPLAFQQKYLISYDIILINSYIFFRQQKQAKNYVIVEFVLDYFLRGFIKPDFQQMWVYIGFHQFLTSLFYKNITKKQYLIHKYEAQYALYLQQKNSVNDKVMNKINVLSSLVFFCELGQRINVKLMINKIRQLAQVVLTYSILNIVYELNKTNYDLFVMGKQFYNNSIEASLEGLNKCVGIQLPKLQKLMKFFSSQNQFNKNILSIAYRKVEQSLSLLVSDFKSSIKKICPYNNSNFLNKTSQNYHLEKQQKNEQDLNNKRLVFLSEAKQMNMSEKGWMYMFELLGNKQNEDYEMYYEYTLISLRNNWSNKKEIKELGLKMIRMDGYKDVLESSLQNYENRDKLPK